jgi:hypothetical protein
VDGCAPAVQEAGLGHDPGRRAEAADARAAPILAPEPGEERARGDLRHVEAGAEADRVIAMNLAQRSVEREARPGRAGDVRPVLADDAP